MKSKRGLLRINIEERGGGVLVCWEKGERERETGKSYVDFIR